MSTIFKLVLCTAVAFVTLYFVTKYYIRSVQKAKYGYVGYPLSAGMARRARNREETHGEILTSLSRKQESVPA